MVEYNTISQLALILTISILILPVIGSLVLIIIDKKNLSGYISSLFALFTLISSVILSIQNINQLNYVNFDWFTVGSFSLQIGFLLDNISLLMLLVVSLITLLVNVFSIEYMGRDEGRSRYFMFLGLFAFSMYGIVLSSNLFLTFFFWELVGFSSYLLIGFWFREEEPPKASFKAFIINRIGDSGFLIGLFILFAFFGTFELPELWLIFSDPSELTSIVPISEGLLYLMGIGLFLGAVGKSAQFPLQTWLPDAMAGPTPVSALIHAATMVAAGVFMLIRVFPLLSEEVLTTIAIVGSITAFMGAFAAFAQNDIKKVLAYSTISQLGYMVMSIGIGAPQFALFHLITHAFFKACLFLCAGSIIHYLHEHISHHEDAQDMNIMGGLRLKTPVTFLAYTVSMLALCGIPFFSGYFSKESIVLASFNWGFFPTSPMTTVLVPLFALSSVFMTAAYMGRQYFMVFFGECRVEMKNDNDRSRESLYFKVPLIILAFFSLWFIYALNPIAHADFWLLDLITHSTTTIQVIAENMLVNHTFVTVISLLLAVSGLFMAYWLYCRKMSTKQLDLVNAYLGSISVNNWYLDHIYNKFIVNNSIRFSRALADFDKRVVDGVVNISGIIGVIFSQMSGWFDKHVVDGMVTFIADIAGASGNMARRIQGGNIHAYFVWAVIGLVLTFLLII